MTFCEIGHFIEDEEIFYDMPLSSKYSDSYILKKEFLLLRKIKNARISYCAEFCNSLSLTESSASHHEPSLE